MIYHKIPEPEYNHPKAQLYQYRMKKRPTKSESNFDYILQKALTDFDLPVFKATQWKKTWWNRKPRKFKKQRIFRDQANKKTYIADFYIPQLQLVFEIDGASHKKQKDYDAIRSSFLATQGIKVVRLLNEETDHKKSCISKTTNIIRARMEELSKPRPKVHITREQQEEAIKQFHATGGKVQHCPTAKGRE